MKTLIDRVVFSDRDDYDCTYTMLDTMLQSSGYNATQILHDEWCFVYQKADGPCPHIFAKCTSVKDNLANYGICVEQRQTSSTDEAWDRVRVLIDKGQPVPAAADTYYLERYYYPGYGRHTSHYVILCGYDEQEQTVWIVDPSPWKRFKGALPWEGFKRAWGTSYISPNTWLEFSFPLSPPQPNRTAIENILRRNLNLMSLQGDDATGSLFGIEGIRALATDLINWAQDPCDSRKKMGQAFDHLRQVVTERRGHAEFLAFAAIQLENRELADLSGELEDIARNWVVTRNIFFKGKKRDPSAVILRIQRRLLEIAHREEKALFSLRKMLGL